MERDKHPTISIVEVIDAIKQLKERLVFPSYFEVVEQLENALVERYNEERDDIDVVEPEPVEVAASKRPAVAKPLRDNNDVTEFDLTR